MKRLFKRLCKEYRCGLTEDGYFSINDGLIIKHELLDGVGLDYSKDNNRIDIKEFLKLWNDYFKLKEKYPDRVAENKVTVYDVPSDRQESTAGLLNVPVYEYEDDENKFVFKKAYIDLIEKLIEKNKKKNINKKIYYFEFKYICRSRYYNTVDYLNESVAVMVFSDENGQILAVASGSKE